MSRKSPARIILSGAITMVILALVAVMLWWRADKSPESAQVGQEPAKVAPVVVEPSPAAEPAVALVPPEPVAEEESVEVSVAQPEPQKRREVEVQVANASEEAPAQDFILREEARRLSPSLAELGESYQAEGFEELEFPLFDGQVVVLNNLRFQKQGHQAGVFMASVAGDPDGGHVVLSYVREATAGMIHIPASGEYYEIRPTRESGHSILAKLDPSLMPECGTCVHPPPGQ